MNAREEIYLQMNRTLRVELDRANERIRREQEHIRQLQIELDQYKPTFYKPRGSVTRVMRNINERLMTIFRNFNRLLRITGFKIDHFKISDDIRTFDVQANCPCISSLTVRQALYIKVIIIYFIFQSELSIH